MTKMFDESPLPPIKVIGTDAWILGENIVSYFKYLEEAITFYKKEYGIQYPIIEYCEKMEIKHD